MANDITELREALFETLRGLKNGNLDPEKARAINETAQTLVNTAKVEIDYLRTTAASSDSAFFGAKPDVPQLPGGTSVVGKAPGVTVTRHRLVG